jgi:Zn-dependent oligopeptidase
MTNPLLDSFDLVPFDRIKADHFLPAVQSLIAQAKSDIEQITLNPDQATFENTMLALEHSGLKLERVSQCFFNLLSAHTNEDLQQKAQQISPLLSAFKNDILMNAALFERVKAIFDQKKSLGLSIEQERLLEQTYKSFCRNGALLNAEQQKEVRSIDNALSKATLNFGNNVLSETNAFSHHIVEISALEGLPQSFLDRAKERAREKDLEGYLIGLEYPSYMPVMKFAKNRDLRQKLWLAYGARAAKDNEQDNKDIIREIVSLRQRRAEILGYPNHAAFVLEERMAKSPEAVNNFLSDLSEKARPAAEKELKALQSFAFEQEQLATMQPWDQAYFSEGLKKKNFNWDEEKIKEYFPLNQVLSGVFDIAHRLFGLKFELDPNIPVYHPEVKAYRVNDQKGDYKALLYTDFHPRPSKRDGAWMTSYKSQYKTGHENHRPHISIVCNFTHPDAQGIALLSFQEVTTLFHEFGHALHGMLADTHYPSLSGTSVSWDFVELPSQIMENWCFQQESLSLFAKHYKTQESLPLAYLEQITALKSFQEGLQTLRQISFASLDMAYHDGQYTAQEIVPFERNILEPMQLLKHDHPYVMSTAFSHIFQGGYAAGYYSYKWAEVLDADAFSLFEERGIFDPETAQSFAQNILSQGGTEDPMTLYKRFRGREPRNEALLRRAGLITQS